MQHKTPDPNASHPIPGIDMVIYVKPARDNPNIVVGNFTCFADKDFGERVAHHYDFYSDKPIIDKFYQIAKGVEFVMNSANHRMARVSTFPFYIFGLFVKIGECQRMPSAAHPDIRP